MWEQIHIFFDIASAIGAVIIPLVGLFVRAKFFEMKEEIMDGQRELMKTILEHGGKCDAERAELFRTASRIETASGQRGRDYFNDKRT